MKKIILFIASICLLHHALFGVGLTGKVVIKDTPLPINQAKVTVTDRTVLTNTKGYFELNNLDPGAYTLSIAATGYVSVNRSVIIPSDNSITIELPLFTVIKATSQTVFAERENEKIAFYSVDSDDITRLSEASLFSDVISSLQMLPGVGSSGSFDTDVFIRGGDSGEFQPILDDVPLFYSSFFGGGVSIFNSKTIDKALFYPGGYDVTLSQRLSGVLELYSKKGDYETPSWRIDSNLTETNIIYSTPLKKGESSIFTSYRRTYYDIFAPLFTSSNTTKYPYFQSFQSYYSHKLNSSHSFNASINYFNDGADVDFTELNEKFEGNLSYDSTIWLLRGQMESIVGDHFINKLTVSTQLYEGIYEDTTEFSGNNNWDISSYGIRNDSTWTAWKNHTIQFGGALDRVDYGEFGSYSLPTFVGANQDNLEGEVVTYNFSYEANTEYYVAGTYIQDEWQLFSNQTLTYGLRWDISDSDDLALRSHVQPRVSYTYQWSDTLTFKTYYGRYKQNNYAFNFQFSEGDNLVNSIADIDMSTAEHIGTGFEKYITQDTFFKAEIFYKDYSDLAINSETYPETTLNNQGTGYSKGLEVLLNKVTGNNYRGWVNYSLSESRRVNYSGEYVPDFDITHMLNVYGDIQVNPTSHLIFTLQYRSGLPYTPIFGRTVDPETGAISYDRGDYNSKRLTDSIRLDIWYEIKGVKLVLPIPFIAKGDVQVLGVFPYWEFRGKTRFGLYNVLNTQNQTNYYWDDSENEPVFATDMSRIPIFGYTIFL